MDSKLIIALCITVTMLLTTLGLARPDETFLSEETRSETYETVDKCGAYLSDVCPDEIYYYLFENAPTISEKCCSQLIKMGRACHDLLTSDSIIEFKDQEQEIMRRNQESWERCNKEGQIA